MSLGDDLRLRSSLTIRLDGPAVEDHRIALQDLALFCRQLQTTVDRIAKVLSGQTDSAGRGRKPRGIKSACALEVVAVGSGSFSIVCDLRARTGGRSPSLDLGEQAIEAMVRGMRALETEGPALPPGFDTGVLLALREAGKLLDHGIDRICFDLRTPTKQLGSAYTRELHSKVIKRIQEPTRNRRTVEGWLLMGDFKETGFSCRIQPASGRPVVCSFDETLKDAVLSALTHYVRVVGESQEVDGRLLNLFISDLEILERQEEAAPIPTAVDGFFGSRTDLEQLAREQGVNAVSNFDDLLGDFWPEDETADEFIAAVRRWRNDAAPGGL